MAVIDPSKRVLLRKGVDLATAGVVIGLGGAGLLVPQTAQAKYSRPGAIQAQDKKFPNLGFAWDCWHNPDLSYLAEFNERGRDFALGMMGLNSLSPPIGLNVKKCQAESYGYHLLARKANKNVGSEKFFHVTLQNGNPSLYHYSQGCYDLYHNDDIGARLQFARGMFLAAQLTQNDFERLKSLGIKWEGDEKEWRRNALSLAAKFVYADLRTKEIILNKGIGDKKKYDEEGVYWNLGFCINREWVINKNKQITILADSNKDLFNVLKSNFNYSTSDGNMIVL